MSPADRSGRVEQRKRVVTLRKTRLHADDGDPNPIRGAEAISLVHRLTQESWSLAGLGLPSYTRSETPYRFVVTHRP